MVKTELEEAGLDAENMAETTATLQAKLLALSHGEVDVMKNANEFKSTTEILRELAGAWEHMTDIEQAAAIELVAGKRQANIVASLMTNFDTVEKAIQTSANSEGSALAENEKYLDSIDGKTQKLTRSTQEYWNKMINSDVIKFFLDLGQGIMSVVNMAPKLSTLIGIVGAFSLANKTNPITLFKGITNQMAMYGNASNLLNGISGTGSVELYANAVSDLAYKQQALMLSTRELDAAQIESILIRNGATEADVKAAMAQSALNKTREEAALAENMVVVSETEAIAAGLSLEATDYLLAFGSEGVTKSKLEEAVATGVITEATQQEIVAKYGLSAANTTLATTAKGALTAFAMSPMAWVTTALIAIPLLIKGIKYLTSANERAAQKAKEVKEAYSKTVDEARKNISTISGLKDEFNKLSKGVDDNGKNISLSTDDYQRYLDIVKTITDISPELIRGYDAEGNALANKNELIEESIRLMKQEQQEAAEIALNEKGSLVKDAENNYKSISSQIDAEKQNANTAVADEFEKIFADKYALGDITSDVDFYKLFIEDENSAQWYNNKSYSFALNYGDQIVEALRSGNQQVTQYFSKEEIDTLTNAYAQHEKNVANLQKQLESSANNFNDILMLDVQSSGLLVDLDDNMGQYVTDYVMNIKVDESNFTSVQNDIYDFIDWMDVNSSSISSKLEDGTKVLSTVDENGVKKTYQQYIDGMNKFVEELQNSSYTEQQQSWILSMLGFDSIESDMAEKLEKVKKVIKKSEADGQAARIVQDAKQLEQLKQLTTEDLEIFFNISAAPNSMTLDEILRAIQAVKDTNGADVAGIKMFSTLTEQVEKYSTALKQVQEVFIDNTEVTKEYKDSLIELGIAEEDLNECFYEGNPLVVKNADKLKELVKKTKDNAASNAKLAKSQAMLKYTKLQKEAHKLASNYKNLTSTQKDELNAMYEEMGILQQNISKYTMLEHALLGTTSAYEKFAEAQSADGENNYTEQAESMVNVLADAFNTGKLGTESAQAAIAGLIPEKVFKDADTLEKKMDKIYEYFTGGPISQYFTLEFDDDGKITSVEMTLENAQKFVENGIKGVKDANGELQRIFTEDSTWKSFDLDPAIHSLDQLADRMGVTKEVAFATLQELERYDINWIGGDYSTLLDYLTPNIDSLKAWEAEIEELKAKNHNGSHIAEINEQSAALEQAKRNYSLEADMYRVSSEMAELDKKFISGALGADGIDEYAESYLKLEATMKELNSYAYDKTISYKEFSDEISSISSEITEKQKELNDALENNDTDKANEISDSISNLTDKYKDLIDQKAALGSPLSDFEISAALDECHDRIQTAIADLIGLNEELVTVDENGNVQINVDGEMDSNAKDLVEKLKEAKAIDDEGNIDIELALTTGAFSEEEVNEIKNLRDGEKNIRMMMGMDGTDKIQSSLDRIATTLTNIFNKLDQSGTVKVNTSDAENGVSRLYNNLKSVVGRTWTAVVNTVNTVTGGAKVNGTANANGTAFASGNWGAKKTETSLVGELGPELVVRGNEFFTVGDSGAEMFDVKKDDIIFNHVQTEQLLKNGYINSRGRAYASGTAYAFGSNITTYTNKVNSVAKDWSGSKNNSSSKNSSAKDSAEETKEEFNEVFDWFEVKIEEIDELLELWAAQLENIVDLTAKGTKIDSIINENKYKLDVLGQGFKLYEDYTNKLLNDIPAQYREAAKNGKIAIEEFAGDAGEKTLEAINNYREWAKKVADVQQQMEELVQTIADLAKQKFDVIDDDFDRRIEHLTIVIDRFKDSISLIEKQGNIASGQYYEEMARITQDRLVKLNKEHEMLQQSLDKSVRVGDIKKGSEQWYEMVNAISDVDKEIMDCKSDLEDFQNSINDIYWDSFDELINRIEYVSNETDNLIDLLEKSGELIDYPKDAEYWGANDVAWSKEGLASLGLYAQKMETAEYNATQYAKAIDDLDAQYKAGRYSQSEYLKKLDELKSAQQDSIKSYYEAKDAIVDLNKTRVDAIKNGIEKEISAYEKLINKQKESLSNEKDAYNFQKTINEKNKNVSDLERKIAALSGDYSASAVAERKKLESQLAIAKQEVSDTLYERDIENQQNALDKELDNFKESKDKEIELWEKYLEDTKQVIADSLNVVKDNAIGIYNTLQDKASEYDLTLSDSITSPWLKGENAISSYQEKFNTASSETYDQLGEIKKQWKDIIDLMNKAAANDIHNISVDNQTHQSASAASTSAPPPLTPSQPQANASAATPNLAKGSTVTVKKTASKFATGQNMASFVKGGTYTVYQTSGDRVLIGKNGVYTGWVYKTDLVGNYAKGTTNLKKSGMVEVDDMGLGEELVLGAHNGRLTFLEKGSGVIPADMTKNLMEIGKYSLSEILERSRAAIAPPQLESNVTINMSYGDIVKIEHYDGGDLTKLAGMIDKKLEENNKRLNDSLRRFAR